MNAVCEGLSSAAASGLLPRDFSILLAVSGGADSMALLHGAAEVAPEAGWRLSAFSKNFSAPSDGARGL